MARGDAGRLSTDDRGGNINQTPVETPMRYKGTCGKCGARRIDSQIGLEQTPAAYVAQIVAAMREVWRVLRDDGTLWLNLGDSYAASGGGGHKDWHANPGLSRSAVKGVPPHSAGIAKPKDLMGIPWRVAFALQDDGWYLRSDIIWAKPNPMPESVTDRPTKAHEYVFLLAKQPRYYYDAEAIKEVGVTPAGVSWEDRKANGAASGRMDTGHNASHGNGMSHDLGNGLNGRNARSVWQIATQPYSGAHFATMPPELARRCILAGSSARGQCPKCGAPWARQMETEMVQGRKSGAGNRAALGDVSPSSVFRTGLEPRNTTTGWAASCDCDAGDPVPQIVLDPFAGSGTTAMVALQNGRRAIGTELNPAYLRLQDDRTQVTIGLGL